MTEASRGEQVLELLQARGPLGTGQIAQALNVSRPTALKLLRKLQSEQHVDWHGSRSRDPRAVWARRGRSLSTVMSQSGGERLPDLLQRIDAALSLRRLDPELFERCVADLLSNIYPTLSPVTGGQDEGRDADVPRPGESPLARS